MLPANLRRTNNFSPGSHLRRIEESMAADWSQLPTELLQLISEKLKNTEIYLIRFRSVCSTWRRSSSIPNHPHNYSSLKLPMFPNSDDFDCVRCISKQNLFLIKPPTAPNQQTPLHPWLVRIGPGLSGKTRLWHPLDVNLSSPSCFPYHDGVIDFNKLSVFHLGHTFFIHHHDLRPNRSYQGIHFEKVVVATSEGGQPLALLTYNYKNCPTFFRCGDDSWNDIPTMSNSFLKGDICVFKGRLCVADLHGRTMMIEPDSSVHLLADPVFGGSEKLLVESECQLLLVDTYGFLPNHDDDHVRIDVFRLDEKEKKWVRLTNLGDRVLFLGGDYSFIASASDLCVPNGNCVIYCRSYTCHVNATEFGMRMRIFHLDQGRVSPLSDYPDYCRLFWPPPEWIVGQHS